MAIPTDELALTIDVGVEVADTEAEGPGRRYAIWVQGCPLRCPGCCNPELLRFGGGTARTVASVLDQIFAAHARTPLDGVSLLGGEPFAQARPLAVLAEQVQLAGLGVMIYSGFTRAELDLQAQQDAAIGRLLAATDLLVDGRYVREQPDTTRRWIGSRNQQLHFLSPRHRPDDPVFHAGETIELRLVDGQLIINGWPWPKHDGPGAKGLPPSRPSRPRPRANHDHEDPIP
ncbi:4Fe-4S single cluster domain-containing protein [Enhygromyxa salina]|uniref:Anaerobic ribonucleotide reductase-activating protein n=1 Tax=Enhygromyxa salina TaxID=215803 RepID=A0A2S9YNZ7_9BACT|nr:4Fe-4S single cluster domain-containing protein [Enhygromyxa salina]PRQ06821.1 anaerobic ribonucleotide reductase-activating protein [Enhygromyxa salina]